MSEVLKKVYDSEEFRHEGHRLIDLIADHLTASLNGANKVNSYVHPDEQYMRWRDFNSSKDYFKSILEASINLFHPHYMGHQISPPAPISVLASFLSAYCNNGMGVYEMGGPSTAIERTVVEIIADQIGYDSNANGFLTSGGTLANLTALLAARSNLKSRNIWREGYNKNDLVVLVSEQAHYCIDRAARILGLGDRGIIKIPVTDQFKMYTNELSNQVDNIKRSGRHVLAVVGSACTTSTGTYDNLKEIARLCGQEDIWFHIDGAHGAAVVFSEKYNHLVSGIDKADSVTIDCHKMMMSPSIITGLIFKDGNNSYKTFHQDAEYLFKENENEEWYNLAKRTFECTKLMMGVKFYSIIQKHGRKAIGEFVTQLHNNSLEFAELVESDDLFQLATTPESNIVCYRIKIEGKSDAYLNDLNSRIRELILREGAFYIVQTKLNGKIYFRNTMMNPFTEKHHMAGLLADIKEKAMALIGQQH